MNEISAPENLKIEPSRTLDGLLHQRYFGPVIHMGNDCFTGRQMVPRYTSSIDAAVLLVERTLPGWIWRLCTCSVSDDAWVMPDMNHPAFGPVFRKIWPDVADPLQEGPGIDLSLSPSGNAPLALIVAHSAVIAGLLADARPEPEIGEAKIAEMLNCEADAFGRRDIERIDVAQVLQKLIKTRSAPTPA